MIDFESLIADVQAAVRCPSVTGEERAVAELLASRASDLGLEASVAEYDLDALRTAPGYPGEEAARSELVGMVAVRRGSEPGAPRLAFNGHIDVVNEGGEQWAYGPWSGERDGGFVYGRGSVDMKAGVVAALHAAAAIEDPRGDIVVLATPSEEDGGLGAFAALEADSDFAGCLIPEPTGFELICAQAGALTFSGVLRGRGAHAALRLEGESVIDKYVPFHLALQEHERALNSDVANELMRRFELPYPLLVGRIQAGRWSSQVPDRLELEGRLGVPIGVAVEDARADLQAIADAHGVELSWEGGQFEPAETDVRDPFIQAVAAAAEAELGRPPVIAGATYGSDMRHFARRGIPCAMFGTRGIERAHGVDERVAEEEVMQVARVMERVARGFWDR